MFWENENVPPIDLGNFDGDQAWNTPCAINDRGQVVGFGNQFGTQGGALNPIAFLRDKKRGIKSLAPIVLGVFGTDALVSVDIGRKQGSDFALPFRQSTIH